MDQSKQYTIVDLQALVDHHELVDVGHGKAIKVYGLPVHDMITLFDGFLTYIDEILDPNKTSASIATIVQAMLSEAPELVGRVVCRAQRLEINEKNIDLCVRLPSGIQMAVVVAALNLTFPDGELLGKFWAGVERIVASFSSQAAAQLAALNTVSGSN